MNQAPKRESSAEPLTAPRFVGAEEMLLAGLSTHYNSGMMKGITEQWMRFVPHVARILKQVGCLAFGVAYNAQETPFSMQYMCGVEVASANGLPPQFTTLQLSAHRYAIFPYPGHVSTISQTVDASSHSWLSISAMRTIPLRRTAFPSQSATARISTRAPKTSKFGFPSRSDRCRRLVSLCRT